MNFDDFLAGYKPTQLEEVRKVKSINNDFSELLEKYKLALEHNSIWALEQETNNILSPVEINSFLQATRQYGDHKDYSWKTGFFLSHLILNSYRVGYNHFTLQTESLPLISGIGENIGGVKANPLSIFVQGNTGFFYGRHARYASFSCNGAVGEWSGSAAYHSNFRLDGEVRSKFGERASACVFKTSIRKNIEQLRKSIPRNKHNTLIYIDQGKEVIIL